MVALNYEIQVSLPRVSHLSLHDSGMPLWRCFVSFMHHLHRIISCMHHYITKKDFKSLGWNFGKD